MAVLHYTEVDPEDQHRVKRYLKVVIRRMSIRDGNYVNQERSAIAETDRDDSTLITLYNLPLLRHSSHLYQSEDQKDWYETVLSEEVFWSLEEQFTLAWLEAIFKENPQQGISQLDYLKNFLSGLKARSETTSDLQTASEAPSGNSTSA